MPRTRFDLYGLPVDATGMQEAVDQICTWAAEQSSRLVVTPNVDHFMRWQRDADFRDVYRSASLYLMDGAPLVALARLEGISDARRVTGADLLPAVCREAAARGIPVALIGGSVDANARAVELLKAANSDLQIVLASSPERQQVLSPEYVEALARTSSKEPCVVALCLGSPLQEELYATMQQAGSRAVCLGVGAAINFAAGTTRRAPQIVQRLGCEWLFRLVQEPRRLWRRYLVDDSPFVYYLVRSLGRRTIGRQRRGTGQTGPW